MASTKTTEKVVKVKAPVAKKVAKVEKKGVTANVLDLKGKVIGTVSLPQAMFGAEVNETLLAQAIRVYRANQRQGTSSTKTRGEVTGSTRKIYRQKGTGRARHGGITAPIFVGGGIAFGPKPRDYSLSLPQKMKRGALFSALSSKTKDDAIKIVAGLEKMDPKTKNFVDMLNHVSPDQKKRKVLLVLPAKTDSVLRAARNVEGVSLLPANQLNAYDVMNTRTIVVMKDALETLENVFMPKEK